MPPAAGDGSGVVAGAGANADEGATAAASKPARGDLKQVGVAAKQTLGGEGPGSSVVSGEGATTAAWWPASDRSGGQDSLASCDGHEWGIFVLSQLPAC